MLFLGKACKPTEQVTDSGIKPSLKESSAWAFFLSLRSWFSGWRRVQSQGAATQCSECVEIGHLLEYWNMAKGNGIGNLFCSPWAHLTRSYRKQVKSCMQDDWTWWNTTEIYVRIPLQQKITSISTNTGVNTHKLLLCFNEYFLWREERRTI